MLLHMCYTSTDNAATIKAEMLVLEREYWYKAVLQPITDYDMTGKTPVWKKSKGGFLSQRLCGMALRLAPAEALCFHDILLI